MIVLDTNVLSELMRPQPDARVLDWLSARHPGELRMTAISRAEIRYGLAAMPMGARRDDLTARAEELFDALGEITQSFDTRAADRYGRLVAKRQQAGTPIAVLDAQIAAIASVLDAAVATRNTADFRDLGITIHNPWTPMPTRPRS